MALRARCLMEFPVPVPASCRGAGNGNWVVGVTSAQASSCREVSLRLGVRDLDATSLRSGRESRGQMLSLPGVLQAIPSGGQAKEGINEEDGRPESLASPRFRWSRYVREKWPDHRDAWSGLGGIPIRNLARAQSRLRRGGALPHPPHREDRAA